jgi:23S rRNA pseudouridine2604 synthase
LAGGVPMLGKMTKKCPVTKVSATVFKITLVQGFNRQIRRMCEHFGYEAIKLERTRIMNVNLKGLPVGDWRDLTEKELSILLKSVENSSSEDNSSAKNLGSPARRNNRFKATSRSKGAPYQKGIQKDKGNKPKAKTERTKGLSKSKDKRPSTKRPTRRR